MTKLLVDKAVKVEKKAISQSRHQAGLGLISALFVITVLALLAVSMAKLVANSGQIHSQKILSIRAESAAQSALEIQQSTIVARGTCLQSAIVYQFNQQGLQECSAKVSCQQVTVPVQGRITANQGPKSFITLDVTSQCGSAIDSATQQLQKRFYLR